MTSRISNSNTLRFASILGRAIGAAGAVAGLLLVLALLEFRIPYKPGFGVIILATLLGLAGSVWWVGGLAGRTIARRGRAAVAWGPIAGIACLGIGALSLSLASFSQAAVEDLAFGLEQAAWDYFGKPLAFITLTGAIPAALIGLVCAAAIHCIIARQKRASDCLSR
jgi:hypothetical protein